MKLGNMDLNNLPLTQTAAPNGSDNAMAQIGIKLVDALINGNPAEMVKGTAAGNGLGLKDMLELLKLFGLGATPPTARDSGLPEVMKMIVSLIEQNAKQSQEHMKMLVETLRPQKEGGKTRVEELMEDIAMGVITGAMSADPKKKLQSDLQDMAELQKILGGVSPRHEGLTFDQQVALEKLRDEREHRNNVINMNLKKLELEAKDRQDERELDHERVSDTLGVAREFFSSRKRQNQQPVADPGRTGNQVESPPAGLTRLRCGACNYQMLVHDQQTIHFCPQCGTSFELPEASAEGVGERIEKHLSETPEEYEERHQLQED